GRRRVTPVVHHRFGRRGRGVCGNGLVRPLGGQGNQRSTSGVHSAIRSAVAGDGVTRGRGRIRQSLRGGGSGVVRAGGRCAVTACDAEPLSGAASGAAPSAGQRRRAAGRQPPTR